MGNILESLDSIISGDNGYTTSYHRKDNDDLSKVYEVVDSMSETELNMLEKKINMRKERLQHIEKHKQDPRQFPI